MSDMCGRPRTLDVNKQDGGRMVPFRGSPNFENQFVVLVYRAGGVSCHPNLHLFDTGCGVCLETQ